MSYKIDKILKKIENIIGYTLPNKFKEFYLEGNKNINNIKFLSINEIYEEVCNPTNSELEEDLYVVEPKQAILEKCFDEKRVPFITDYSGNFIGIDFNPGLNGVLGQIINYGADEYEMKVLANTFEDFINGLKGIYIEDESYIMDYLSEKNLTFKKDEILSDIEKINTSNFLEKTITEKKKNEIIIQSKIKYKDMEQIIAILSELDVKLKNDESIRKYKNYWFHLRIINKKDSLSRTMETKEAFYKKLSEYNKEEIKGFSFAITNDLEEFRDNEIYIGEERMFVEINILQNQILVRYTETIKNKIMLETFNNIVNYIKNVK